MEAKSTQSSTVSTDTPKRRFKQEFDMSDMKVGDHEIWKYNISHHCNAKSKRRGLDWDFTGRKNPDGEGFQIFRIK